MMAEKFFFAVDVVRDVRAAGEPRRARGEDARADLLALGRHDAVGGEENRATERFKLGQLLPPGIAVVAHEVVVLFECGICVRGQHLAMGVDIHTRAARLLQQLLQIDKIVSGDEDCGVVAHADVDPGDLGRAVARGVRRVQ